MGKARNTLDKAQFQLLRLPSAAMVVKHNVLIPAEVVSSRSERCQGHIQGYVLQTDVQTKRQMERHP